MLGNYPIGCFWRGLAARVSAQHNTFLFLCLCLLGSFPTFAEPLSVTLRDSLSGQPISAQKVVAYELDADDKRQWRASGYSDEAGLVNFDLANLGSGGRYVVAATVYNNFKVYSEVVTEPGQLPMVFGTTRIQVYNGTLADKPPLTESKMLIYRYDGQNKSWFATAYTDGDGMLKIDLPEVDSTQQYLLAGNSPISGQRKYSEPLNHSGVHQFVLGNLPLNVTVADGLSGSAIAEQRVDVYYYDSEGKKRWYTKALTDDQGQATFDLEGLGSGKEYVLRTKLFNELSTYSDRLNNTGEYQFAVGTSQINVLNGTVSPKVSLPGHKLYIDKLAADGSKSYFARVYSDEAGKARINLPGLDRGQVYLVRAKSTVDDATYYEQRISAKGVLDLVVGSIPLKVTVADAISGQAIAAKEVSAYRINADGSKKRVAKRVTDDQGRVDFDLPEVDNGQPYKLAVAGFDDYKSYSPNISASGDYRFAVGSTKVVLKNGSDAAKPLLANTALKIYQVIDGKNKWFGSAISDEQGIVRLDLPGLNEGQSYRFAADSTVNQSRKYSQLLSQVGTFEFIVGNPALTVKVFNILNNALYANEQVTAYWLDDNGKKNWYQRLTTDNNAEVRFDLDDIANGREYVFKVSKFSTGSSYSQTVTQPGQLDFGIGAVPMTLLDKTTSNPLTGVKVVAYRIAADGQLSWVKSGYTDSQGLLTFDFPELLLGERFGFKARDPFGEGKTYYGPIISGIGEQRFMVKQGEYGSFDLIPPVITIDTPDKDHANATGFIVAGVASDNEGIERVEISIDSHQTLASIQNDGHWQVTVPPSWLEGKTAIAITAKAYDITLNSTTVTRSYQLSFDVEDPVIVVESHQNQQQVNALGFTVFGTVSDDIGVESITASLTDPVLGKTIDTQTLNVSSLTGQWALPVTSAKVTEGQSFVIELVATDINQKTTTEQLTLIAVAVSNNPLQLAQRITFGLTPALLSRIHQGQDILAEQLNPQAIEDSAFEDEMAARVISDRADLSDYLISYMVGSKKQLKEVMAWFWENHFSTDIRIHGSVAYELAENRLFREHALGNFRTLLGVSAKSAAMIEYLNNAQNVAGRANENYARELMELHTMGVDGGYNAQDIAELSRIFTGWHQSDGAFLFNDGLHDNGDKLFLGQTIIGAGVNEGEQALDLLARHPSTASFICAKLVTLFVSDTPVSSLQSQCASEFLASDGDIKSVLRVIFASDAFALSEHYRSKLKTPIELVGSTLRGFNAELNAGDISDALNRMGMTLFEYPTPTGFSEVAEDWLNTNGLLQRMRFANQAAAQTDVHAMMSALGLSSAEAIVSYLLELTMANDYSELEYQLLLSILNQDSPFDFNANDADEKLNRVLRTLLSFPGYQYN